MEKTNKTSVTYKDAGVDIVAGDALVDRIKPFAKATSRLGVDADLGGFGALFDLGKLNYKNPVLVSATDGVGTKLEIAGHYNKHDTIGIDLVAMCVNDLIVQGAEPLFFLDYFACGKLELGVAEDVIRGIADGCKQAGCALIGGETAEMPGMYPVGTYDLAGFAVGAVERDAVLPSGIEEGDVLLGLASSGVHSNGYSLVRKLIADHGLQLEQEAVLRPTKIYVKSILAGIKAGLVKGMAHITGGGITENLPRICAGEIDLKSWEFPEIFQKIQAAGNISQEEMLKTFNCGIGMIVVVASKNAAALKKVFEEQGETVFTIGKVIAGDKVVYI